MSPASKSKSKDKKASKDNSKGSLKSSSHVNTSTVIPAASGYNPLLGTFHTFETVPIPSASPVHGNGRFRNIDDTDDNNGNTSGTGIEYDSISNNGSWSGESEDHKEKPSQPNPRPESVPGADNDKREKIRQKNERKHQRQKERRAQELHERCSGYLMSRKLEALAQQLVAMGFSQERATMALILNEGRVEESVSWLFEGGEEDKHTEHNLDTSGNLKIDISEELACITEMEIKYKASKQEVERAVVSCEGDLEKAEEQLKSQKEEPSKLEETGDPPTIADFKQPIPISQNSVRIQAKSNSATVTPQKTDDRDFNYTKAPPNIGSSADLRTKTAQGLNKGLPKADWTKPQPIPVPAEKRWASAGSNASPTFSSAAPLQASIPPTKAETQYLSVRNELKNLKLGTLKEPVTVMQRPQAINDAKQVPVTSLGSSPPAMTMGWHPNSVEMVKSHGNMLPVSVSRNISPNDVSSHPVYNQLLYQPQQQFVPSSSSVDSSARGSGGSWGSRGGASPTLAAPSSLGLFSGIGVGGTSSSLVDWSTGSSMLQFDYTNIDWSLDRGTLSSRGSGLWTGSNYTKQNNARAYDSFAYGLGGKSNTTRTVLSANGNGPAIPGLQDGIGSGDPTVGSGGSREWTSPFEEKDLFSLPRQFVSSPSL